MKQLQHPTADAALDLAAAALGFLASDPERLGRFLALSGLDPSGVRAAAADPGFLPAVLDYVLADETLLVAFAGSQGTEPERVSRARAALGGVAYDRST
ncbi:DUF3572 domain-containing protein [Methylopila sp. 73B]|uniref:DUF3572 domain-containing protein n=1 Tax=Methylopila sp. 73B TaxID=1120792 RepID=UPI00037C3CA4|nr:DUF3572 domain-containing protein [Methylopila sp. 73B]